MIEPWIVDVSRYQAIIDPPRETKHINWQTMKDKGIKVAGIRCTGGNYYRDSEFHYNFEEAYKVGIIPIPYLFNTPENKPEEQISYFYKYLGDKASELCMPPVLDCELVRNKNPQAITANIEKCLKLLEDKEGRVPIIYTAAWFWNPNVLRSSKWIKYPSWIAWYPDDLNYAGALPTRYCPPDWVVAGVSKQTIWQKWADSCGKGKEYGAWSSGLDLSWYNGTPAQFDAQFGTSISGTTPEPPLPPTPSTIEQRVTSIENAIKKNTDWDLS
jgi:GH25 family lysozyme M1 (1,4-beta-N-acetylmuramidase)